MSDEAMVHVRPDMAGLQIRSIPGNGLVMIFTLFSLYYPLTGSSHFSSIPRPKPGPSFGSIYPAFGTEAPGNRFASSSSRPGAEAMKHSSQGEQGVAAVKCTPYG